jgi:hypothetical protein
MNGPRRLRESGGVSERLLDSASIDKPSRASRARAIELAGTAGAFVITTTTTTGTASTAAAAKSSAAASLYKSVAMWACIGAIGGGAMALMASELIAPANHRSNSGARPPMVPLLVPEPAEPSLSPVAPPLESPHDITPEPRPAKAPPALHPSHPASALSAASPAPAPPPPALPGSGIASFKDETKDIEAARQAISGGDIGNALRILDRYDAAHPKGALKAEAARLRVQAVNNTVERPQPRSFGNDIETKYPPRRVPHLPPVFVAPK